MSVALGQIIDGKYRLASVIGEGGMGAVYAGEQLRIHRKVAIKVLHAATARDPEAVVRFEREAQAAGRIGNDHILEILDLGELPGGDRYMVMEFLDGEPMSARLARLGRMAPRLLYPLARQVLEGLAAAHAVGIVHRDLKPANLFILREKAGTQDYLKIIDFGISKFQAAPGENHSQTQTGTIIGTPQYMSPEQARGLREADARSDIYSLGVIMYEAVSGRCPFEGGSTNDILFKLFVEEAPPLEPMMETPDPAFASIVMCALAKDPTHRFHTAPDFLAALDAWFETGQGVALMSPASVTGALLKPQTVRDRPYGERAPATPLPSPGRPLPGTERSWSGATPAVDPTPSRPAPLSADQRRSPLLIGGLIGLTGLVAAGSLVALMVSHREAASAPGASAIQAVEATTDASVASTERPATTLPAAVPTAPAVADLKDAAPSPAEPSSDSRPASPAATSGKAKKIAPHDGKATAKSDCNPPYVVNSQGARVYKEQCL